MARQDYGDDLTQPILQSGWKLSDDGFGLHTLSANYVLESGTYSFVRGTAFEVTGLEYLKLHRWSSTSGKLGIQTITAEYVGIPSDVNSGAYTNPQIQASNGLTTEPITSNPNFRTSGGDGYDTPIAGDSYTQSDLGPPVKKKPSDLEGVPVVGNIITSYQQSWIGNNGACFEREEGGRFIGFVDPAYPKFYGKTSYLAPTSAWSGIVYVSEGATVQLFIAYLGSTASDNDWASTLPTIVPTYAGTTWLSADGDDQLLLSQVKIEDFGNLKKVSYEVRFSKDGWSNSVYPNSDSL